MMNLLVRALEWAGVTPTDDLLAQFDVYRDWLMTEATVAGGVGPAEGDRIEIRHLADSVLFAGVWERRADHPVLDVGTGVGLPGIPLALAVPSRQFLLLDRSGRRIRLLRRIVRVLELPNVEVVEEDIARFDWSGYTTVSRASLSPGVFVDMARRKGPPREMLIGGSHQERPEVAGLETIEIPPEILARAVWILRMGQ